jgi:hypothetical protein
MTPKYLVKVYKQGAALYVIGTDDAQIACRAAGITPETHRWSGTGFGQYVRRQAMWRTASEFRTPKDAKPGVAFYGHIRERA